MSFILEALRKSEAERQRHQSPGMADLRARNRASGRRYWLPLVIFLVGLNIGLLLFLWLNSTPPTTVSVANAPAAATVPAITAPEPAPMEEGTVSAAVTTAGPDTAASMPATAVPDKPETVVAKQPVRKLSSELAPQPVRATVPTSAPSAVNVAPAPQPSYGNLPTLTELTLAGTLSLAPLRIDMHVFSPQPAERFVFINMNKYREGESLREGPVLTTITPDGVILDYQGRSFLVTRE